MSAHKRRRSSSCEDSRAPEWSSFRQADLSSRHRIATESPSTNVNSVKPTATPSTGPRFVPTHPLYFPPYFRIKAPTKVLLSAYLPASYDYKPCARPKSQEWYWYDVPPDFSAHLVAYNLLSGENVRIEDLQLPKPVVDLTITEVQTILAMYMNETSRHVDVPITYPRIRASDTKWGREWRERQAKRRKLDTIHEQHARDPLWPLKFPIQIVMLKPQTEKAQHWAWHRPKDSTHLILVNDLTGEDVRIEDLIRPKLLAERPRVWIPRILYMYMNETSGKDEVVPLSFPRIDASDSAWGKAWREKRMVRKIARRTMSLPIRQFK